MLCPYTTIVYEKVVHWVRVDVEYIPHGMYTDKIIIGDAERTVQNAYR